MKTHRVFCPGFALLLASAANLPAQSPAALKPPAVVQKVCYDCHGDGAHKGSFAIDELLSAPVDAQHRGQWLKVWKNVRHEFMPPPEGDAMSSAERRELTRWIEQQIFGVDPARPDPGVVTIRRLNRAEYNFTVNDLLGTAIDFPDKLPPDDTAYGFDNIGEAQTLSPSLLSRYLDLAEFAVSSAILTDGRPLPKIPVDFKLEKAEAQRSDQNAEITVAHAGRYKLRFDFTFGGWQDFGGDYRIQLIVDDKHVVDETVPLGGDTDYEFPREVALTAGKHQVVFRAEPTKSAPLADAAATAARVSTAPPTPAVAVADAVAPAVTPKPAAAVAPVAAEPAVAALVAAADAPPAADAAPRRPARAPRPSGLNMKKIEVDFTGPIDAGVFAEYPETHRKIFFKGDTPAAPAARLAYARDILRPIASRAFRRPADNATVNRLADLAVKDQNFERGVGRAVSAILASPRFLFREEPQPEPDNPKASHAVDDYALASRLSYFFWLSFPDDELNALAAKSQLRANLAAQVRRMLADPKSKRFFEDFTGQWLRTRNILTASITPDPVGKALDPVRKAMKDETDMFFEFVAREDRDLVELITADYTFLNQPLAEYYGIPGVTGTEMQRVSLPKDSPRGGVLTQGSFLVATSNPNRTSPVKRGVFVLENIFGTPPPPPPPNIPNLDDARKEGTEIKTLRQQLALHRADKACAACHAYFDPIGLALENFNHAGKWREKDGAEPVETAGEMVTGEKFANFAEVRGIIAQHKEKFYRGLTEHLMTYMLGRGLEPYDAITVDRIADTLLRDGGKFSTLVTMLVESPAFQARRGDGDRNVRGTASIGGAPAGLAANTR